MLCDSFYILFIDITQAFLKSPGHTNTVSFENASFTIRFRKPEL